MIPICRDAGSVVAFGGRSMEADQSPKYLNSPETPIYSKGRTLYGLNLTKAAIRKFGYAVLVEGYFDFAQVFQTQAAPVVASCGTALTLHQASCSGVSRRRSCSATIPTPPGRAPPPSRASCWSPRGSTSTSSMLNAGEDPDTFIRKTWTRAVPGASEDIEAVSRVPARSGVGRARFRPRRPSPRSS